MSTCTNWKKGRPLKGIIPPLITPLIDQNTIDREGTARLLEHVLAAGVSGIFVLGSTGEGPSLSHQLRRDFIRLCCEIVRGRVPLLVGVSDTSFVETVNLAKFAAAQTGASAVVLTSPYYYPCSQNDLIRYITHVVKQIDFPVLLYNMPGLTKLWFEIDTVRALAKIDKVVGIKDSSGDLDYFSKLCALKRLRPDWTILVGPDHLTVQAVNLGGDGGVPGGGNFEPGLFVSLYKAASEGNEKELSVLVKRLDILQEVYRVGPWFVATKCACSLRKLCHDIPAEPFSSLSEQERTTVQSVLERLSNEMT